MEGRDRERWWRIGSLAGRRLRATCDLTQRCKERVDKSVLARIQRSESNPRSVESAARSY